MADITIVGLGPGPAELRTVAVQQALDSATTIFVRDHFEADFSDLLAQPNVTDISVARDPTLPAGSRWQASARTIVDAARSGPVVLAIPGHPRFGEMLTVETIRLAEEHGLSVVVLDGISMIDVVCTSLDIDPVRQRVQPMDGRDMSFIEDRAPFSGGEFGANPRLPMLITHVYNNTILQKLTAQLQRILPTDHPLTLISHAGLPNETIESLSLNDLAQHDGGGMLAIYVPPQDDLEATRTPLTLQSIMARLRREDGCPWDREQTNESLAASLADEAYEAIDAIQVGDDANFAEELGDLLMLIMMHAQMAEERGAFALEDVYHGINTKIVRRHPHVFGDDVIDNAERVLERWQQIKAEEKAEQPAKPQKAADGQPHSMPALERARRVLKKHPIDVKDSPADQRQRALLDAVAAVINAGDDPNVILKLALENHVTGTVPAGVSGEKNASR